MTKNFSVAKCILAALWKHKELGRMDLLSSRYIKYFCSNKNRTTFRSTISRLFKQKLIKKDYNDIIALAELGRREALFAFIEAELSLHKKEEGEWDGGWRIVLFDIPEYKRKYRDYLRKVLKVIGFKEFQRSIWIYPYPVPAFLKELLFEENMKPHIRFVTSNLIDEDEDLKELFGIRSNIKRS